MALTKEEEERMHQVAKEAAHVAFGEYMQRLGVDDTEWREVQQDLAYLRRLRGGSEQAARWVMRSALTVFVTGILWAIWDAIKHGGIR